MLVEFFLERSRIELAADGLSYTGSVPDLPEIRVTAATPDQCRINLAAAVAGLLEMEARGSGQYEPRMDNYNEQTTRTSEATEATLPAFNLNSSIRHSPVSLSGLEFTDILYEKKDWVARVTINRPAAYNAYTDHTLSEMAAAFRDAARDDKVAVLVLTGAGDRAFSTGGDVKQHCDEHLGNPEAFRAWMNALIEAHTALRLLGKPSIARINGIVAGGGNDWNLACDLAIAADHAKFVQIETKVGLLSAGAARWLPILIGERRAREMALTGEPISANKALLWGLVNDVVPYKELDATVAIFCQKLIDRFPESTRIAREQLSFWKDLAWNSMTKGATDQLESHFAGEEASEGLRALAEKREVDYRAFRSDVYAARDAAPRPPEKSGSLTELKKKAEVRSCYSCGAQDLPGSFDYCGFCGTRLV